MKSANLIILVFMLGCTSERVTRQTAESDDKDHQKFFGQLYLGQNSPNPVGAHQSTTIPFRSIEADDARIIVFGSDGKPIIVFDDLAGKGSVTIDEDKLVPGAYTYCLFVAGRIVQKMKLQVARE